VQELVASLRPDGRSLALEALLRLAPGATGPSPALPPAQPAAAGDVGLALLAALQGQSDSLALVQQPSLWPELWQPLLAAVLRVGEGGGDGLLPALVTAADPGPLLWSAGSQGWLLGTAVDRPDPASLEQGLAAQGLTGAPLPVEGDASVMVWTRLEAPPAGRRIGREEGAVLQASLAGARTSQGQLAWWGQNLAVLQEQRESRQTPRLRLAQLAALDQPQASLQWAMAAGPAQALLQRWSTWQLLSGLAGRPLAPAVQGLSLSLEPGDSNSVHLSARVGFG
jgi:hypothetical protein